MVAIDKSKVPRHVAIIMDGNGRWAEARGLNRIKGHQRGVEVSEEIITEAREMGVGYLTLYAFSKENWLRPRVEVEALMALLEQFLVAKKEKMIKNGIRLNVIGEKVMLPSKVAETLDAAIRETSVGGGMVLTLALSYGSRDEIVRAVRKIMKEAPAGERSEKINEALFTSYLDTAKMPDPDLIIRTGGETRMSNFLLWQGAYAELIFEDCFWPEFTPQKFREAVCEYQRRERRFGRTSEQLGK